jgi:hypothetical protein
MSADDSDETFWARLGLAAGEVDRKWKETRAAYKDFQRIACSENTRALDRLERLLPDSLAKKAVTSDAYGDEGAISIKVKEGFLNVWFNKKEDRIKVDFDGRAENLTLSTRRAMTDLEKRLNLPDAASFKSSIRRFGMVSDVRLCCSAVENELREPDRADSEED